MTQLQLSGFETLLGICIIAFIIIAIIFSLRKYLQFIGAKKLLEKNTIAHKTLDSRTKHPEVNIFNWTRPIFLTGLAAAICISLFAFSWTVDYQKTVYSTNYQVEADPLEVKILRTKHPTPEKPKPKIEEAKIVLTKVDEVKTVLDLSIKPDEAIELVSDEPAPEGNSTFPAPPKTIPKIIEPEDAPDEILPVAEQMPRFPGCEDLEGTREEKKKCAEKKLLNYIYDNLKYPQFAIENGIEGVAIVRFVVDEQGHIKNVKILKNPGGGCGDAALKVVEAMNDLPENWTPGRQRGRKVKVMYTLPIKFKLK